MANPGETKIKFGRQYTFINPNATIGPGVWRLSNIDDIASQGEGSGGAIIEVDGVAPITSTAVAAGEVDVSIDLTSLDEK